MKNYVENEPKIYIMYLDADNLYGWAMSQYLPTGGFQWLTEEKINELNLSEYKNNTLAQKELSLK